MTTEYSANPKADLTERIASIRIQLADMEQALKEYEQLDEINYGHVGDLGHVQVELSDVVEFLVDSVREAESEDDEEMEA